MSEIPSSTRSELFDEYFKVVDILQSYDPYFLTIKNWGVTVSGAAVGLGVSQKSAPVFVLVCVLATGFWITEVRFKLLQLGHTQRASELEQYLSSSNKVGCASQFPRILGAFGEQSILNIHTHRWRSVIFWPQVMFPHVIFLIVGMIGLLFVHSMVSR